MEPNQYLEELSKCVKCGSCKAFCPIYEEDSIESMSARGRITLLWALSSAQITASSLLNERIFGCTLCGRCEGLCPLGLNIIDLICHGRTLLKDTDKKRKLIRFFSKIFIKKSAQIFNLLYVAQPILLPYLAKKGIIPPQIEIPRYRFRDRLYVLTVPKKRGRIAVFTGCIVNFLYPDLGQSFVNVFHKLGYEIVLPAGEVCCGIPLISLGLEDEAIKLAKKNVEIFKRLNVDSVLSLCPTCTLTIRKEYPKLIGEGIDKAEDISIFLIDKIELPRLMPSYKDRKAIYHDPCHLKYGLGIEKEPREIIKNIGINLIKTTSEKCCGFAGLFCFSFRELSEKLLKNCVEEYLKTEGDFVITSCPGCIMQLSKKIKDRPVVHLIEIIEEAIFQEK